MQADEYPRFQAVLTGMAELYQRELSAPLLDAYWIALGDWELEDFECAAGQLMRTSKFMPRPADFHELRKAGLPTGGEIFARVLDLARDGGDERCIDDPVMLRAVRAIGGMEAVRMSDRDVVHFLERRFMEHFESIQDAQEIRDSVPQIAHHGRRRLNGPVHISQLAPPDNRDESSD